ncbi:hypothetical protein FHW69_000594 [Luteibacter sp. Sphag1AF]|uniref:hypothetical protein n=1 Tax=Luteibacter sp. Sphag1AF TaxID=2587031 RepID=UPI001615471C|nr:hypothetical protein [Luteibacter sp. Sphag1AF]MBB3226004.1 hypothetical protein [Luteibacter sp. Sphag1AF]
MSTSSGPPVPGKDTLDLIVDMPAVQSPQVLDGDTVSVASLPGRGLTLIVPASEFAGPSLLSVTANDSSNIAASWFFTKVANEVYEHNASADEISLFIGHSVLCSYAMAGGHHNSQLLRFTVIA